MWPFSLQFEEREGIFSAEGVALRGVHLAPILAEVGAAVAVVFNVSVSLGGEDGTAAGAGDIAAEIGVEADVLEMADGQQMLAMASADLAAFFDRWRGFGG